MESIRIMSSSDTQATLSKFKAHVATIQDFGAAQALMGWDMETYMPHKAAHSRARQVATLATHSHALQTAPEFGQMIEDLSNPSTLASLSPDEQCLVNEVKREYDRDRKLSSSLVQRLAETTGKAHTLWVEARKNADFKHFSPILKDIIALNQEMAEALGYEGSPYNALLDIYERDLNTTALDTLFGNLKPSLVKLVESLKDQPVDDSFLRTQEYDPEKQLAFGRHVLEDMGFDFDAGRQDLAPHPFCSGTSLFDVRLTTRVFANDPASALFSSLHECGHGLYEQGIDPKWDGTPICSGTSLGIHESQSRLWENMVGRSMAFWTHYYPQFQALFPEQLGRVSLEQFYRAINKVQPSYIRVEADEVTYNLHIVLRYELERDLIEGKLAVDDIPDAWNAAMVRLLGITPPDASKGCLQDIHWSHGTFGYFPTYTLGNIYAAQIFDAAKRAMPQLEAQIARGELHPLRNWLKDEIHQYGKSLTPNALIQQVTGEAMNAQYMVKYMNTKFMAVHAS
jgi:carboxypeptidase Taq